MTNNLTNLTNTRQTEEPVYYHFLIDADDGRIISEKHLLALHEAKNKNAGFALNNVRIKYVRINEYFSG